MQNKMPETIGRPFIVIAPPMAQDVADFHKKFKIDYAGPPRMIPANLKYFRHQRNEEEGREWYHAPNRTESLDAIVDQIYIILGTAHLQGFTPEVIAEAWRRVHASNMQKERATVENLGKGHPDDIVKPKGWTHPDLSDLVGMCKWCNGDHDEDKCPNRREM